MSSQNIIFYGVALCSDIFSKTSCSTFLSNDLIFFALVDALAKGVDIKAITTELRSRFNDN